MNTRGSQLILAGAWLIALCGLLLISYSFAGESTRFLGIADDQEQIIRFAAPVEISQLGFVSGQAVNSGDAIVEVRQPELDAELQIVDERIQALKFGNRESRASMESEIVRLQADLQASHAELDSTIDNLRARQSATANILSELDATPEVTARSPLQEQIASLSKQKRALRRAADARINDLRSQLGTPERAIDAQISELQKRREEIRRQQQELNVRADLDGRIGSVLFKVGDTVPPYQPVVTVHGTRPTFVKGYIHENVVNGVRTGQTVWIRSVNSGRDDEWIEGLVEGLGSRIVEFPLRLKVNPLAQAWGREVVIQIQSEHSLLLGEKVSVQLDRPFASLASVNIAFSKVLGE